MYITDLLRRCLHLSYEWGAPVFIASLDILTAFDLIDYHVLLDALVYRGWPAHFAAAVLQELIGNRARADIPDVATFDNIDVGRGGRQGGADTVDIWNTIIETLMDGPVQHWHRNGYGFSLDDMPKVNHAV